MWKSSTVCNICCSSSWQVVGLTSRHSCWSTDTAWSGMESLRCSVSCRCSEASQRSLCVECLSLSHARWCTESARTRILTIWVGICKCWALTVLRTSSETTTKSLMKYKKMKWVNGKIKLDEFDTSWEFPVGKWQQRTNKFVVVSFRVFASRKICVSSSFQ